MLLVMLMLRIVGTCYKIFLKNKPKEFKVENVIIGKGDKLHVKWKGCNNSFNSWIDEKMSL